MLCVMHVNDGNELRAERFIEGLFGNGTGCFHLTRLRRKKYGGKWQTIQEPLLPGYVFIVTEEPERLYRELRRVPGYGRGETGRTCGRQYGLLGSNDEYVAALESSEADFIEKITGKGCRDGEIALSFIRAGEDGRVSVLSGPLLSVKDRVRKIDFHKRVAEVETELLGETKLMYLGVEFEGRE